MTEVEFSRQLSELSKVAKVLNSESDSINDLLSRFEEKIREMNVGLEVGVFLDENERNFLQWKRLNRTVNQGPGKPLVRESYWGLAVNGNPVLGLSREERITALEYLPHLVAALTNEAKARVGVIQKARTFLTK